MKGKKRLGIFVFYDRDGIVDEYVTYLLRALRQELDRLVIVCNGVLQPEGRRRLEAFTQEVYVRENRGYDAAAYRAAFEQYLGWRQLEGYEELVLCNDTFYGPFWPLRTVFDRMDERPELDFWGLTVHARMEAGGWQESRYGCLPEHLQSYFLVVRSRLLHAQAFREFWRKVPREPDTVRETISEFEVRFTHAFSRLGYRWAPYADTRSLDDRGGMTPVNPNVYNCAELVERFRCPILKRRAFTDTIQEMTTDNGNPARALAYVASHSDYDISMILRHLLRLENITTLKNNLQWNYILPTDHRCRPGPALPPHSALVVMHLFYPELVELCAEYIRRAPEGVDVLVTTGNPAVADRVRRALDGCRCTFLGVERSPARGRDVSAFLVAARPRMKNYRYVCFTHDKRTTAEMRFYTVGESFRRLIMDNVLASEDYICNVLDCFERNPALGVLAPPPPYLGRYFNAFGNGWQQDFDVTRALARRLGLRCSLDPCCQPYVLGTSLWFRTEAMLPLLEYDFRPEDFPPEPLPADGTINHAVERIFPYVAQSQGFYAGWCMTEAYGALYLEQTSRMLAGLAGAWNRTFPPTDGYAEMRDAFGHLLAQYRAAGAAEPAPQKAEPVWGAREAFLAWDRDLLRAARLAEEHNDRQLRTIGFASAWAVFRISLGVWLRKHSPFRLQRRMGRFMADQRMPSVRQTWWLTRKTFEIWVGKLWRSET